MGWWPAAGKSLVLRSFPLKVICYIQSQTSLYSVILQFLSVYSLSVQTKSFNIIFIHALIGNNESLSIVSFPRSSVGGVDYILILL